MCKHKSTRQHVHICTEKETLPWLSAYAGEDRMASTEQLILPLSANNFKSECL